MPLFETIGFGGFFVWNPAAVCGRRARLMRITAFENPRLTLWVCGYKKLPPGVWNHDAVSSPHWHLYWNANPGALIRRDGRTFALAPSDMILIAPHTVFSTSNDGAAIRQLYVHFEIPDLSAGVAPHIVRLPVSPALRGLIGEAVGVLSLRQPPAWRLALVSRALVDLAMARIMDAELPAPRLDARVLKALSYLNDHLGDRLANADLARLAGMSASAFGRLFKAQVGYTPHAYALNRRIEQACLRLQCSGASIKEIAEATGFCDRYYFSRMFKRLRKTGPSEFRRWHRDPFAAE
jgi:AraC-like DNA-binding protein